MRTKITKGLISIIKASISKSSKDDPRLDSQVSFSQIFLKGVKEPIEVCGTVPYTFTGRSVSIVESSTQLLGSKKEKVKHQIFSNTQKTLLYECSFTRRI